jgi:hypothetical protein
MTKLRETLIDQFNDLPGVEAITQKVATAEAAEEVKHN